ncbi:MAG TPA: hypothetical protein VGL42_06835 [Opitutaceae bacterium]|jgi:hypothetical protein
MKFIQQVLTLFSVILFGSIAMVAFRTVYQAALPERPAYTPAQERLVAQLSGEVRDWLGEMPAGQTRAVFANLDHDDFAFVSAPVREAIWRSGRFDLAPRGFVERLRQRIGWTSPHWSGASAVAAHARIHHADVAIAGSVTQLTDAPESTLNVRLEITRPASGETIATRDFALRASVPLGAVGRSLLVAPSAPKRMLAWVALVLLLPLALFPFARDLLVDGSNALILGVLLALVALDVGSATLLYANQVEGWMGAVLILVIFGVCFGLNAQYLTWIKRQAA